MVGDNRVSNKKIPDEFLTKEQVLERFLEGKKKLKADLIALPFEEKIRRVIEMQKMEREFKKDQRKKVYVWNE